MEQHIGLGHHARIVSLGIKWPASQSEQEFTDVATDQFIAIKEFDKAYTRLNRKPFHLGGLHPGTPVAAALGARP
jgi:hypothetical protein